jgi:hypothetical protein
MRRIIALALTVGFAAACSNPTEPTRPAPLRAGAKAANDLIPCTTDDGRSGYAWASGDKCLEIQ